MADREATGDVAARALEDPEFALTVLKSDKYPDVRQAILEELADAASKDTRFMETFVRSPSSSGDRLGQLARQIGRNAPDAW